MVDRKKLTEVPLVSGTLASVAFSPFVRASEAVYFFFEVGLVVFIVTGAFTYLTVGSISPKSYSHIWSCVFVYSFFFMMAWVAIANTLSATGISVPVLANTTLNSHFRQGFGALIRGDPNAILEVLVTLGWMVVSWVAARWFYSRSQLG